MDAGTWVREWPKCILLLELALSYASTGRTRGCEKLTSRLEEWRVRMTSAPQAVHTFLSELCYVSWLLGRGDHETARHHALEAQQKARDIGRLLERQHLRRPANTPQVYDGTRANSRPGSTSSWPVARRSSGAPVRSSRELPP
jgi:hypothetical protein